MTHLPHSLEAEICLLGCLLLDPDCIAEVIDHLGFADFYNHRNQHIYKAICHLYTNDRDVDVLTVFTQLKDSKAGISVPELEGVLNSVPFAAHTKSYMQIVLDKAKRRSMLKSGQDLVQLALDEKKSTDEATKALEGILDGVNAGYSDTSRIITLDSVLETQLQYAEDVAKDPSMAKGLSTGLIDLDDQMLGGLHAPDLFVIAARPMMGKTALALAIARNVVLAEETCLFVSLEMGGEQLADRLLAQTANLNSGDMKLGKLNRPQLTSLKTAADQLRNKPLFIETSGGLTPAMLRKKAKIIKAKHGLSLLVVDYLQLMHSDTPSESEVLELKQITRALKLLAIELDIPILLMSQLNRAVEKRESKIAHLSDLRGSGTIEQDADIVCVLYRENYYNQNKTGDKSLDIVVKKHRNGPLGTVKVFYDLQTQKVQNLSWTEDVDKEQ